MFPKSRVIYAAAALCLALLTVAGPSWAQFGRNKVQYRDHHWQVLTTPHFQIYFYDGEERFAARAGLTLEDGYAMLSGKLNESLPWRVPVILYSNHNDFLQTNTTPGLLPEGVQAFAEPSRKRIVLPFTGSYPEFEHTAVHELAHVFTFHIVYNRLMDNVFSRNALFGMPLWIAEGVAEYLSVGWDTEADMFIRDAIIHDYLPDLNMAGGFMVYKGGQSAFNYIEQTYGREKVLEILDALAVTRSADGALTKTIGLSTTELSRNWKKSLRKHYWPMYADKTEVGDLGRKLTNHNQERGYYNTKPAFSPDGERIAFFSDRGGLISIYILSTIDGRIIRKLVQGHRSNRFESLHFYTSSLCWSPDGKMVAFVAKSGGQDVLYLVDSQNGDVVKELRISSEGMASPTWSPKGDAIVVSATFHGQTDLVSIDVESGVATRLTYDVADQLDPTFFPDGRKIAFVYYPDVTIPVPGDLSAASIRTLAEIDFLASGNVRRDATRDIYTYDLDTGEIHPLVETKGDDLSPIVFDGGERMIFTSDESGIRNLYVADLKTGVFKRVTDVLSGVLAPDVNDDNSRLVFTAFSRAGYDLYVCDDLDGILENDFGSAPLAAMSRERLTSETLRREGAASPDLPLSAILLRGKRKDEAARPTTGGGDTDEWVFSVSDADPDSLKDITVTLRDQDGNSTSTSGKGGQAAPSDEGLKGSGSPSRPVEGLQAPVSSDEPVTRGGTVSDYKLKLAPDFVGQGAGLYFSSAFGFGLANTIAMSDMLNNHRMIIAFNIYRDITDSDLYGTYIYLKRRINYGVGAFQFKNYLNSRMTSIGEAFNSYRLFTERNYGMFGFMSYPFDTFNRLDFELQAFVSERQFFERSIEGDPGDEYIVYNEGQTSRRNLIEPTLSFVHDASFFSYFGPIDGSRYALSIAKGFGLGRGGVDRTTLYLDYRWYKHLWYRNALAFRTTFAASEGADPRVFFLGGATTLRGWDYWDLSGTRIFLASLEYRFPAIDYLIFGWPAQWGLGNLGGSVFFDVGNAWDGNNLHQWFRDNVNGLQFDELRGDIGFGVQLYMAYFLLNFQVAWQTDLNEIGPSQFHFYIGPQF